MQHNAYFRIPKILKDQTNLLRSTPFFFIHVLVLTFDDPSIKKTELKAVYQYQNFKFYCRFELQMYWKSPFARV